MTELYLKGKDIFVSNCAWGVVCLICTVGQPHCIMQVIDKATTVWRGVQLAARCAECAGTL